MVIIPEPCVCIFTAAVSLLSEIHVTAKGVDSNVFWALLPHVTSNSFAVGGENGIDCFIKMQPSLWDLPNTAAFPGGRNST
jgi:hypothetical protein